MDEHASSISRFVLVLRAAAGFYFGKDDPLPTMRFLTQTGPTEITFGTARTTLPGFTHPVRHGIWCDVRGEAHSFDDAVETWANWARGVAAILSVAANAPVGNLTADLGYDDTQGRTERLYWRRTFPDIPLIPHRGRKLPAHAAVALITAWMERPVEDQERWHRAFNAYHSALQEWEPGLEIPLLGHLWVGMEALTPIARDTYLAQHGMTHEELAKEWEVDPGKVDAEVRLRLLFDGNADCYAQARKARNGLLHGYDNLWKVRERSLPVRFETARYLRRSLFALIGLDPAVTEQLLSDSFDPPFHWSMFSQMFGTITSEAEHVAAAEDIYPRVDWIPRWRELSPDEEGDAQFDLVFAVLPRLAPGAEFKLDRIQVLLPRAGTTDDADEHDK